MRRLERRLALLSLYRRTTLRMPAWEAAQLVLGLAVPPLLIAHIVGTRFTWFLLGQHIAYERIVGVLWSNPWTALRQATLLAIVWTHLCFGIHYWLRIKRWYPAARPALVAAALLIPSLALAGFAAAGNEIWPRIGGTYQLRHASGRVIVAPIGRSILEALRDAGIPHASVCGGRARCTTCRVRINEGLAALAPPAP